MISSESKKSSLRFPRLRSTLPVAMKIIRNAVGNFREVSEGVISCGFVCARRVFRIRPYGYDQV